MARSRSDVDLDLAFFLLWGRRLLQVRVRAGVPRADRAGLHPEARRHGARQHRDQLVAALVADLAPRRPRLAQRLDDLGARSSAALAASSTCWRVRRPWASRLNDHRPVSSRRAARSRSVDTASRSSAPRRPGLDVADAGLRTPPRRVRSARGRRSSARDRAGSTSARAASSSRATVTSRLCSLQPRRPQRRGATSIMLAEPRHERRRARRARRRTAPCPPSARAPPRAVSDSSGAALAEHRGHALDGLVGAVEDHRLLGGEVVVDRLLRHADERRRPRTP